MIFRIKNHGYPSHDDLHMKNFNSSELKFSIEYQYDTGAVAPPPLWIFVHENTPVSRIGYAGRVSYRLRYGGIVTHSAFPWYWLMLSPIMTFFILLDISLEIFATLRPLADSGIVTTKSVPS